MILAADYPFLDVLWTMVIFFAWVIWIWMMIYILSDLFGRSDISGWGKAAWTVFMIVLPFVGVLSYLIAQHEGMQRRGIERAQAAQQQFDDRVKAAAGAGTGNGAAGEIQKAAQLRDAGTITSAEFETIKTKALAAH
jgi:hypothetical protein